MERAPLGELSTQASRHDDEHGSGEEEGGGGRGNSGGGVAMDDAENAPPNVGGASRRSSRWAKANAAQRQIRSTGELSEGPAGWSDDDEVEPIDETRGERKKGVHRAEQTAGRPEGASLNGHLIALWAESGWRRAEVVSYSKKSGKHKLRFEDMPSSSKPHSTLLKEETWEVVSPPADEPAAFDPTASMLKLPQRAAGEKLSRTPARAKARLKESARSPNATKSPGPTKRERRSAAIAEARTMANEESGADEETTGRPQQQQLQPRARALTALAKSESTTWTD